MYDKADVIFQIDAAIEIKCCWITFHFHAHTKTCMCHTIQLSRYLQNHQTNIQNNINSMVRETFPALYKNKYCKPIFIRLSLVSGQTPTARGRVWSSQK